MAMNAVSEQMLTTLSGLVSQQPEPLRPVLQHVANMLRLLMIAFVAHVVDTDALRKDFNT